MNQVVHEYHRLNPFMASLAERYPLTNPLSQKSVYHMVLDLRGSGMEYKTGDSLGIYPLNDPVVVRQLLARMGAKGDEEVTTKKGEVVPFDEFLSSRANIARCSKKMLGVLAEKHSSVSKKAMLESLLLPDQQPAVKEYLEAHEVWDLLEEHSEASLAPQELCDLLSPLMPRFYSIASSPVTSNEWVHLTVALTQYTSNTHVRRGVCSYFLSHLVPACMPVVPVYVQPSKDFTLTEDHSRPIIMVGPGTGVAPYRGFMEERVAVGASGKSWLFFGEWTRTHDFYYEEYWNQLVKDGHLRLDTAFSRDQANKVYVQHKLLENAFAVYRWLEEGAIFYVCGDAEFMAKDVDQALHTIVSEQSGKGIDHAKSYVKAMREESRYLRDIY